MAEASTVISFEGGLDLVTPVQESAGGVLTDCLNYEVGPIKGYKRIDGYEKFDGLFDGGVSNVYRLSVNTGLSPGHLPNPGGLVQDENLNTLGVVVDAPSGSSILMVPVTPGAAPVPGNFYYLDDPVHGTTSLTILSPSVDFRDLASDAEAYANVIRNASFVLRNTVASMPDRVAGVYHGRTRAYAVVDCAQWDFSNASDSWVSGGFYRYQGAAYRAVGQQGNIINLIRLPNFQSYVSSDFEQIDYGQLTAGTGNVDVITDIVVVSDVGARYAQPYALKTIAEYTGDRTPQPLTPAYAIRYTAASGEPVGTLTIDVGGSQTVTIDVIDYSVDSGSFGTSDAEGLLHASFVSATSGWDGQIDPSDTISDGGGVIATISSADLALWAGTGSLYENELTHYVWGTYNFKATRNRDFVYCANGKTRAGWIEDDDTPVYGNVHTSGDVATDIPKYLSFHAGQRLALAFANGSCQLSAVSSPLNFSGFDGALEIGNGDNITGMLEASGDSTLLFGPRTIRRIVGQGTSLNLATVSTAAGAFDYTACVTAGVPVYVNQNGVCTLDQTSAYGDFKNSTVSGAVDTWLTPRIIQDTSSFALGGVVCAIPVRDKNQYRLFLGDGSVLNLSLTRDGVQPMLSNYRPEPYALRVPLAFSSSVNDAGSEFVLVVWDRVRAEKGDRGVVVNVPDASTIYRLDKGWGFNGLTFEHYADTSYMFNQDPQFLSITKAILYGLGYGYTSLRLRASGVQDSFETGYETTVQDISMPRSHEIMYTSMQKVMGVVDHANWGRAVRLRFSNIVEPGQLTTEPPHILQSARLFVQTDGITE